MALRGAADGPRANAAAGLPGTDGGEARLAVESDWPLERLGGKAVVSTISRQSGERADGIPLVQAIGARSGWRGANCRATGANRPSHARANGGKAPAWDVVGRGKVTRNQAARPEFAPLGGDNL